MTCFKNRLLKKLTTFQKRENKLCTNFDIHIPFTGTVLPFEMIPMPRKELG